MTAAFDDYVRKTVGNGLFNRDVSFAEQTGFYGDLPGGNPHDTLTVEPETLAEWNKDSAGRFDPAGKSRAEIKAMQTRLIEGGHPIKADGIWGPKSQAAYDDYMLKSEMDNELENAAKLNGIRGYASSEGGN